MMNNTLYILEKLYRTDCIIIMQKSNNTKITDYEKNKIPFSGYIATCTGMELSDSKIFPFDNGNIT